MTRAALIQELEVLQAQLRKLERARARMEKQSAQLSQNEDLYRSLFGRSRAVMLLIDPTDGTIVDANEAACQFYGWDRKTLLKKNISEINMLPKKDLKKAMSQARAETRNRFVFKHRRANRRPRDVEVVSSPITIGGRTLIHSIVYDITPIKRAERALEKAHNELEAKVTERTLDLQDAKIALEAEIEDRKDIEDSLKDALRDKDLLVKEVHHRTKNNLTVIQSLLRLQSRRITDQNTRDLFDQSRERLQALSMVHERLYRSADLRSVEFSEYVRSLAHALAGSHENVQGHIRLNIDIPKTSLGLNSAIPCGLIINELVTNSIKHAFPEGRKGTIRISFQKSADGQCWLEVADDGIGFPPGTSIENSDSFGIEIVRSLTTQLHGTFGVQSGSEGTVARITFMENKA